MIQIKYLENIDFEPLILRFETDQPFPGFGTLVMKKIREWETNRTLTCICHQSPLEIFLFESDKTNCKIGIEWACMEKCIPNLVEWLENQKTALSNILVGEKQLSSSSKSYAFISVLSQTQEDLKIACNNIEYDCYLDFNEDESFIYIENLEHMFSNEVIKIGKKCSQKIESKTVIWRNVSDIVLEAYIFRKGIFHGSISTSNEKNDFSLFEMIEADFPNELSSMFQIKKPKSKRDLHFGICTYCDYGIESIGVNYKAIDDGKFTFGRDSSSYIKFNAS